jgi:hypothetical protein
VWHSGGVCFLAFILLCGRVCFTLEIRVFSFGAKPVLHPPAAITWFKYYHCMTSICSCFKLRSFNLFCTATSMKAMQASEALFNRDLGMGASSAHHVQHHFNALHEVSNVVPLLWSNPRTRDDCKFLQHFLECLPTEEIPLTSSCQNSCRKAAFQCTVSYGIFLK